MFLRIPTSDAGVVKQPPLNSYLSHRHRAAACLYNNRYTLLLQSPLAARRIQFFFTVSVWPSSVVPSQRTDGLTDRRILIFFTYRQRTMFPPKKYLFECLSIACASTLSTKRSNTTLPSNCVCDCAVCDVSVVVEMRRQRRCKRQWSIPISLRAHKFVNSQICERFVNSRKIVPISQNYKISPDRYV